MHIKLYITAVLFYNNINKNLKKQYIFIKTNSIIIKFCYYRKIVKYSIVCTTVTTTKNKNQRKCMAAEFFQFPFLNCKINRI